MIKIQIVNDCNSLRKIIHFEFNGKCLSYPIDNYLFIEASKGGQDNRLFEDIVDFVYNGFNDFRMDREQFSSLLLSKMYGQVIPFQEDKRGFIRVDDVKEEPVKKDNTPLEIKEAISISEKALKYQKRINSLEKEIKNDVSNYYKKHGTLIEKCKAYLGLTLNK